MSSAGPGATRLHKALAHAGVASRRACEALVAAGRVRVNGEQVATPGLRIDPDHDRVEVDGQLVQLAGERVYILLNKPRGYVSTARDPHAERTVMDLVGDQPVRLWPVGRLDADSQGLLLLTNDGELANRLLHPRHHVARTYRVVASGFMGREAADRLAAGVTLSDGVTSPASLKFLRFDQAAGTTEFEIEIREGRNRQVRRMLAAVGHPVRQLTRVRFGPLRLARLAPGTYRKLTGPEVDALRAATGQVRS